MDNPWEEEQPLSSNNQGYTVEITETVDVPPKRWSLFKSLNIPQEHSSIRWIHRKSGFYDDLLGRKEDVDDSLGGNGLRIWYSDYTTIDWIHDYIKDKLRIKSLRRIKGFKGFLINSFDACQAWILLLLIGLLCGCIASGIDIMTNWMFDIKSGWCQRDWRLNKQLCCSTIECSEWKSWSDTFHASFWIDYSLFVMSSVCLACIASFLVVSTQQQLKSADEEYQPLLRQRSLKKEADRILYHSAGSGIPEMKTILSGFVIRGFLGFKTLIVKSIGVTFSVASGLVIGKQGPLLHISCCIGNVLSRLFEKYSKNEGKKREILSASSAAGVAVAFAAPIGGILFSLEEVSYYFPLKTLWRSYFCALIATVTIKMINPLGTGKLVPFQVTYDKDWHSFELIPFVILGFLGGLYGAFFIRLVGKIEQWKSSQQLIQKNPIAEVAIVAFLTATVNWMNVFSRMSLTELVALLFGECKTVDDLGGLCQVKDYYHIAMMLLLCLFVKVLFMVTNFGTKVPFGMFTPSLAIGACIGRLIGMFVEYLTKTYPNISWFQVCFVNEDCVLPGVYAMVGAAAVLCGVTRMTVSLVVIMFELTGALTYALPIMISIIVSKWTADAICIDSLHDYMIYAKGHPFINNKRDFLHSKNTMDLTEMNCETLDVKRRYSINELEWKLEKVQQRHPNGESGLAILDEEMLVGFVASTELEHAIDVSRQKEHAHLPCFFRKQTVDSFDDDTNDYTRWMDQAPVTVSYNTSLELVMQLFSKLGVKTLMVVKEGRFIGMIHKIAIIAYLRENIDRKQL